jgi:predicted nucleotidyltransferase
VTLSAGAAPDGLDLQSLADRLTTVEGVVGVVRGGSRARGDHTPDSDVDLGIYYRGDLEIASLGAIARDVAGADAEVTERGGWGPWVDGGGWLVIDDVHVDWLYRDVERVREAWARAHRGAYHWNAQTGHPLGVPDFAYVGELALAVVLADPDGDLTDLRDAITYPDALRAALARNLWEADFLLQIAGKGTSRGDSAYVALCLSRAMLLCAHALHAHDRRWLVNEKGAITSASRLPCAPADFARRVGDVLGSVGTSPAELAATIENATRIVEEVKAVWTSET